MRDTGLSTDEWKARRVHVTYVAVVCMDGPCLEVPTRAQLAERRKLAEEAERVEAGGVAGGAGAGSVADGANWAEHVADGADEE